MTSWSCNAKVEEMLFVNRCVNAFDAVLVDEMPPNFNGGMYDSEVGADDAACPRCGSSFGADEPHGVYDEEVGFVVDCEAPAEPVEPMCFRCGVRASDDPSAKAAVAAEPDEYSSAAAYVREDGTFNSEANVYACDACYIAIGMPSSPTGWMAPGDANIPF